MNLLFITHYTGRGGGESVQLNLMGELRSAGYILHLVTPKRGVFNDLAEKLGVTSHILPFRGASTYFIPALYQHFPIVGRLTRLFRELAIDWVHSDYHALPFAVGAGRRAGIPVLWNAMGGWFQIKPWQYGFFQSAMTRKLAITRTVHHELSARLPPHVLADMEIIIPGIDPAHYDPATVSGSGVRAKIGIDDHTPLVSLIGRFQHIKGQHIFLEMARRVLQTHPETYFALSGDNVFNVGVDESYKQSIIQSVEQDPLLKGRVTFLGFWPDSREVLAASDVIACTSYSESLGMVVIEAMAMGRAVVSTCGGGPSETVLDGVTGVLATPGDPGSFASAVNRLLSDPRLRSQLGAAGRVHVAAELSVKRYAERFRAVIETPSR